jgi:hypothetical protein
VAWKVFIFVTPKNVETKRTRCVQGTWRRAKEAAIAQNAGPEAAASGGNIKL